MGLGRAFKKIGSGFIKVGKFVADFADIPFATQLVTFVPVVGPAMAIAIRAVDKAEEIFSKPGSGKIKMAWALERALTDLKAAGLEEKRILGLLELALLVHKGEAMMAEVEEN